MTHSSIPVASALRESLAQGYSPAIFRADISAGIVVALIALPLSMALAIAVGLPPQHGLYTGIIAGIVTAVFGGSRFQVSGPTAAFVAILVPIVAQHGLNGLIWCQLMAGAMLVLLGILRLGKFINLVPYVVTIGFTAGIAVVIATLSLNDFFGLRIEDTGRHYWDKVANIVGGFRNISMQETVIGASSLLVMFALPRLTKAIPSAVAGVVVGTGLCVAAAKMGLPVDTIASRFSYMQPNGTAGAGIPPYLPRFYAPDMIDLMPLVVPAMTVALLAALESLLSAAIADNITETKYDPDSELVGIGLGNLATGFFAGIPATGALARTAANIHAGAKTPMASVYHGLILMIFMVALARYISEIPMAALAALLLATAWRMAQVNLVVDLICEGNRQDVALLSVTFFLTVIFDMVAGVGAGLALAYIFHLAKKREA